MILTEKCENDFYDWFCIAVPNEIGLSDKQIISVRRGKIELFKQLTSPMQYGVYTNFFDNFGINIDIKTTYKAESYYGFSFHIFHDKGLQNYDSGSFSNTRNDARKAALLKANELYNKQFNWMNHYPEAQQYKIIEE